MEVKTAWQDILNRYPPITHETMLLTDPFYAQAVEVVVGAIINLEKQLIQHNPEFVCVGRYELIIERSFIQLCHYRMLLLKLVADAIAKSPTHPAWIVDNPVDWFSTPISSLFKAE